VKILKTFKLKLASVKFKNDSEMKNSVIVLIKHIYTLQIELPMNNHEIRNLVKTILDDIINTGFDLFSNKTKIELYDLLQLFLKLTDSISMSIAIPKFSRSLDDTILDIFTPRVLELELYLSQTIKNTDFQTSFLELYSSFEFEEKLERACISTTIFYCSLFISDIQNRQEYFFRLCKLAALHDGVDTVECFFNSISKSFPTLIDFTRVYMKYCLENWDNQEFPYFLVCDDYELFMKSFLDLYALLGFKRKDFELLKSLVKISGSKKLLFEQSFLKVYVELFQTQKKEILEFYGIGMEVVDDFVESNGVLILFEMLVKIRGLDKTDPVLDTDLAVSLCMVESTMIESRENKDFDISSVEKFLNDKITGLDKLPTLKIYELFHEFSVHFYRGNADDSLLVLTNGYLLALVCSQNHLSNLLICHTIMINLLKLCKSSIKHSIPLLEFVIKHKHFQVTLKQVAQYSMLMNTQACILQGREQKQYLKLIGLFLEVILKIDPIFEQTAQFYFDKSLGLGSINCSNLEEIFQNYDYKYSSSPLPFQKLLSILDDRKLDPANLLKNYEYLKFELLECFDLKKCLIKLDSKIQFEEYEHDARSGIISQIISEVYQLLFSLDLEIVDETKLLLSLLMKETSLDDLDPQVSKIMAIFIGSTCLKNDRTVESGLEQDLEEFWLSDQKTERQWASQFLVGIITNHTPELEPLIPLLLKYPTFAVRILPYILFHTIKNPEITKLMKIVFENTERNKIAVKYLCKSIKFITIVNGELNLDYLLIAQSALVIGEYILGMYYLEFWYLRNKTSRENLKDTNVLPGQVWQNLLDCYKGLEEEDGFQVF
jgi:hypothetical protein